jgi:hypothetical protein
MLPFNIPAFTESFLRGNGSRADANETAVFGRALEHVLAEPFNVEYIQTKARQLFTFNTQVGNGAQTVTYNQYDRTGRAKLSHTMSDDVPVVEISGKQASNFFKSIEMAYGYSIQEWREAQMAGLPLDAMKASAVRIAVENEIERIACTGDTLHNLTGIASATSLNVPLYTQGTTAGLSGTVTSGKVWLAGGGSSVASPSDVIADLNLFAKGMFDSTVGLFTMDRLVLPTKLFSYMNSTPGTQAAFNDSTIMKQFLATTPWIKIIDYWDSLSTAGADGKGRILGTSSRNPRAYEFMMSQDFESFPPTIVGGTKFMINCHARVGGFQIRAPLALAYMDGCGGTLS